MSKQETPNAQLIHHYTHVVCALNETRKNSEPSLSGERQSAADAIDYTIKGVCQLINSLVAQEHVGTARAGAN